MPFEIPTAVGVNPAGIVYVANLWPAYLWGFDLSGDPRAMEGDEPGYTSPITSYRDIAVSPSQGVFVLDSESRRVFVLDQAQQAAGGKFFIRVWPAVVGETHEPELTSIAVDARDTVYIVDAGAERVLKLDSDGRLQASWGIPRPAGVDWQVPDSIAVNEAGESYVGWGTTVAHFDASGKLIRPWPALDAAACDTTNGPEFGHQGIGGLAVGRDGALYIADKGCGPAHTGAQLRVVDSAGRQQAAWPVPSNQYPGRVALDEQGQVYCLANIIHGGTPGSVLVFDPSGRIVAEWVGTPRD